MATTATESHFINQDLEYHVRNRRCIANTNTIAEWLRANNLPINFETASQAYQACRGKLIDSQAWTDACNELREAQPDVQFSDAVFGIIADAIDSDAELSSRALDGDLLELVFREINKRQPFPRTQRYLAQQNDIQERARLIEEISLGRTDFYEARDGGSYTKKFSVQELYTDTTERLREIHGIVMGQRELLKMDSKQWLEEKRKESIRRDQERVGLIPTDKKLPSHWTPSEDGTFSNTGTVIRAGVPVALTREVFCRLSKTDMRLILSKFGSKLVDELLQIRR
jgi:hypothetical protein